MNIKTHIMIVIQNDCMLCSVHVWKILLEKESDTNKTQYLESHGPAPRLDGLCPQMIPLTDCSFCVHTVYGDTQHTENAHDKY